MEACTKCTQKRIKEVKLKIIEEIKAFMAAPNNFNVLYNPTNGFYKFEGI